MKTETLLLFHGSTKRRKKKFACTSNSVKKNLSQVQLKLKISVKTQEIGDFRFVQQLKSNATSQNAFFGTPIDMSAAVLR